MSRWQKSHVSVFRVQGLDILVCLKSLLNLWIVASSLESLLSDHISQYSSSHDITVLTTLKIFLIECSFLQTRVSLDHGIVCGLVPKSRKKQHSMWQEMKVGLAA